ATRHVIFRDLYIHDIGTGGNEDCLKLSGVDDYFVLNSEFTRCGGDMSGSGVDHVGCHGGLLAGNYFHDLSANAVQCKGGSEDIEIRANHIVNAGERGVNMGGSTDFQYFRPPLSTSAPNFEARDIRVVANVIEGGVASLAFVGCVDCLAAHNTLIAPTNWLLRILQETTTEGDYEFLPSSYNTVVNNLVYFDRSDLHTYVNIGPDTAPDTFTFANNLWYAYDAPAQSQPNLPVTETDGIAGEDPLLADPAADDYHLQTGSPAIGQGATTAGVTEDYDGVAYASPPSIGAFEFVTQTTPVTPTTDFCPALPAPTGNLVNVDTVAELVDAIENASSGDVILIADGTYDLSTVYALQVETANVTIRSASGNREAVVLDGNYGAHEIFNVSASNVTLADLTLREAIWHPIHVTTNGANTLDTVIYNVHIIDPGEQAIKINPGVATNATHFTDNGLIACSHIELTDAGRPHISGCYTGGVDAHQSRGWTIRDNVIEGFWCESGLSEHGIHMWRSCRDTTVERNVLRDNARAIGFGLVTDGDGVRTYSDNPCPTAEGYVDDYGGIIRNNFIAANDPDLFASQYGFDCGICLWNSCNGSALHNTIYTANGARTFSAMEWRFPNTLATITNNLANAALRERENAVGTQSGNLDTAAAGWFANAGAGDLHLLAAATDALDAVTAPADAPTDMDGEARPGGALADVGADELVAVVPPPAAVTDLRVVAVDAGESLVGVTPVTVTLRWTPPAGALTTTLRTAAARITEATWAAATLLTAALPGDTATYTTAPLSYTGGALYFALKTAGAGGESALSNIAFWPNYTIYLPVVIRQ
ncbi:MAG: right-handed parallel beta-helix repeat-containing protein, partial [Phycisphaerae bacterium]|nr:right-handed parallel beta-helix repeat-containing protein [Phycisphaerae bacterium]